MDLLQQRLRLRLLAEVRSQNILGCSIKYVLQCLELKRVENFWNNQPYCSEVSKNYFWCWSIDTPVSKLLLLFPSDPKNTCVCVCVWVSGCVCVCE